jgi:hypothetical protein
MIILAIYMRTKSENRTNVIHFPNPDTHTSPVSAKHHEPASALDGSHR